MKPNAGAETHNCNIFQSLDIQAIKATNASPIA